MSECIELRGLRCSAIVGILDEERLRPQPLVFDLDLERPFAAAALHDDIHATTNYAEVLALTCETTTRGAFHLLETLATRVGDEILAFDSEISAVTVAVRKVRPPVAHDVDTVGVRCTVRRP